MSIEQAAVLVDGNDFIGIVAFNPVRYNWRTAVAIAWGSDRTYVKLTSGELRSYTNSMIGIPVHLFTIEE